MIYVLELCRKQAHVTGTFKLKELRNYNRKLSLLLSKTKMKPQPTI